MARSPIPNLIEQFHSLSPEEQKVFLDLVDPQPEEAATPKQKRKPRQAKTEKRGLPQADLLSLAQPTNGTEPICTTCGNVEDYQDHFKPSPQYHPFVSSASSAKRSSSRKKESTKGDELPTQNSETALGNAGVAASAASSGD